MTLFAGVYSRRAGCTPSTEAQSSITAALSRSGDTLQTYVNDRVFVAKLDLRIFAQDAFVIENGVATLTGDPLLSTAHNHTLSRPKSVAALMASETTATLSNVLTRCRGNFSYCHYRAGSNSLVISVDRIGHRPLYYFIDDEMVYFSSCLRVFDQIDEVPKRMSLRAVAECGVFGYPLGDRTPYANISSLRGGQILECNDEHVSLTHYYRWGQTQTTQLSRDAFIDTAYKEFCKAVDCRSDPQQPALAFLSGGLDSRAVVASLVGLGRKTHTLTFKYGNRQDGVYGEQYAKAAGTIHATKTIDNWYNSEAQKRAKQSAKEFFAFPSDEQPNNRSIIFAGTGGSVGVGCVHMDDRLLDLLRANRIDDAISYHLQTECRQLSRRIMRSSTYNEVESIAAQGLREELQYYDNEDPAKSFYAFLMDNGQRRHYEAHTEDIDKSRTEFMAPFMDGLFLERMESAPVDWLLYHRMYNDWLTRFHEPAYSTPWQSYPGHLSCPIQAANDADTQWQRSQSERYGAFEGTLRDCRRAIFNRKFPFGMFRWSQLLLAVMLHSLRLRSCTGALKTFHVFEKYYRMCGGKVERVNLTSAK